MLSWYLDGTEYSLDDRTYFYLLNHEGFNMPPVRRLSERGPLQHGDTDRGYRLDPRTALITLGIKGDDLTDFYEKRDYLTKIFGPRNNAGQLRWTQGSATRQLDCHLVDLQEGERSNLWQRFVVALKASDPSWYHPTLRVVYFAIGGGADTMEVPTVIPMTVGATSINQNKSINYPGTVKSWPIIRITGPATNPVLEHNETGYKLNFEATTIAAADYREIDCRYGYKTVEDSSGANKISELSDDSNIAEFSIEIGINSFNFQATGADENTEVTVSYYDRYLGV